MDNVRFLIHLYIKYDLLSQEQFIYLNEYGKQEYIRIMRDGFYPRLCLIWMKQLIEYLDGTGDGQSIQTLNKTIQQWLIKERLK